MADDTYDPNAYVPVWVNILVPIGAGLLFLAVIVLLYYTDTEVPMEYLEKWAEHVPLLNKYLTTEWNPEECDNTENKIGQRTRDARNTGKTQTTEQSHNHRSFSERPRLEMLRYDSISTIKTLGNVTVSEVSDSRAEVHRPYFHASQGTLLHFETNV